MQLMIEDSLCSQMIGFCTRKKEGKKIVGPMTSHVYMVSCCSLSYI